MAFAPVLHSEWIKIRTLRSMAWALLAMVLATACFSALAGLDSDGTDFDPLYAAFFGVNFGQVAAIAFGTTALSSEFHGGALGLSLAAVPHRGRWFTAKTVAIGVPALAIGLVTGFVSLVVGKAVLGDKASGISTAEGLRGAVGCGVYLALMALFAAGLTAVLRSGVATLSVLVPFLLIVSFVVGGATGGVADFLPDKAGQVILHETSDSALGPWTGLAVTAIWTAVALAAGAWSVRRRDA
ncbi:ABC transporter permease [Streptomyces ipomoeae]|uniref:ABC transporter permease n=1 Tax=Streptomyces ipomoeae TaxID=103232 RepID=UPI001147182D|nr:ABC transporter permease [Streptomyces ipomoeae]MDX2820366.1 ABC transporter permease [Streptomyces ipomoeae]MDX2872811.1 ABC transporter permease [Streptomyces ipomoeae]MDX2934835.1 ABC transporter permease [Streptomyces ipomoeae]TQE20992.1 ABC transporter permease [Streptomyces ipomoeae]